MAEAHKTPEQIRAEEEFYRILEKENEGYSQVTVQEKKKTKSSASGTRSREENQVMGQSNQTTRLRLRPLIQASGSFFSDKASPAASSSVQPSASAASLPASLPVVAAVLVTATSALLKQAADGAVFSLHSSEDKLKVPKKRGRPCKVKEGEVEEFTKKAKTIPGQAKTIPGHAKKIPGLAKTKAPESFEHIWGASASASTPLHGFSMAEQGGFVEESLFDAWNGISASGNSASGNTSGFLAALPSSKAGKGFHSAKFYTSSLQGREWRESTFGKIYTQCFGLNFKANSTVTLSAEGLQWATRERFGDQDASTNSKSWQSSMARYVEHIQYLVHSCGGGEENGMSYLNYAISMYCNMRLMRALELQPPSSSDPHEPGVNAMWNANRGVNRRKNPKLAEFTLAAPEKNRFSVAANSETRFQVDSLKSQFLTLGLQYGTDVPSHQEFMDAVHALLSSTSHSQLLSLGNCIGGWWSGPLSGCAEAWNAACTLAKMLAFYVCFLSLPMSCTYFLLTFSFPMHALSYKKEILIRKAPRHGLSSGSISGLIITLQGPSWPEQIDALAVSEAKNSSDDLLHKAFYGSGKGNLDSGEKSGIENWIFDSSGMVRLVRLLCLLCIYSLLHIYSFSPYYFLLFYRTMRIH